MMLQAFEFINTKLRLKVGLAENTVNVFIVTFHCYNSPTLDISSMI